MLIQNLDPAALPVATRLLAAANATPYDVAAVAEEKLFGKGLGGPPRARVALVEDELAGVAVSSRRFVRLLAVDPRFRRRGIGSALLADAEHWIAKTEQTVRIAAEPGNYFTPGVFRDDEGSSAFFASRGYSVSGWAMNLSVDLRRNRHLGRAGEPSVRRAQEDDRDRVVAFISEVFGEAWSFEAAKAFGRGDGSPTLFVSEAAGELRGFSAHDVNNRGLGFFGPAGVVERARSRGIGTALLLASLNDLRDRGFARAIISWAASVEFYRGTCGAEIAHQFTQYSKQLDRVKSV